MEADELVRWAETYGHPEEWAKKAQALHARVEAADALVQSLETNLKTTTELLRQSTAALRDLLEEAEWQQSALSQEFPDPPGQKHEAPAIVRAREVLGLNPYFSPTERTQDGDN